MLVHLGDADALKEGEGWAEAGRHKAHKESGPPVDYTAEVGASYLGLSEEEGEDSEEVTGAE